MEGFEHAHRRIREAVQLFDGERSYEEISEEFAAQTGQQFGAEELRLFADELEESKFWYKSPQESSGLAVVTQDPGRPITAVA